MCNCIYICAPQSRALCIITEFLQMYASLLTSTVVDSVLHPFVYVELSMEGIRNVYAHRSSMCSWSPCTCMKWWPWVNNIKLLPTLLRAP